ncbi:MAG: putative toxin-antitoxin system toxin component, PIN family [Chloroflexi bacterium]|nr:putative toxin-antitoxin system toxin component, PIN family [Chloroflexota bacterium]
MKLWQMLRRLLSKFGLNAVRVVVDTNVLVSGTLAHKGFPARVIDAAIAGQIQFVVSTTLIEEYLEVIQRPHITKRYLEIGDRVASVSFYLDTNALHVFTNEIARVVPSDPDDDFLIACAVEGQARYIVSGDEHLLELGHSRGVEILAPRDFVEQVLN